MTSNYLTEYLRCLWDSSSCCCLIPALKCRATFAVSLRDTSRDRSRYRDRLGIYLNGRFHRPTLISNTDSDCDPDSDADIEDRIALLRLLASCWSPA